MARRTISDIERIWTNVEGVKKLSDRVIGVGPFGVGLDGLLTWAPLVGTIYTVGAGGWLMLQAVRVKASPGTMARMAAYLGLDSVTTAVGEIPFLDFVPNVIDVLFPGHLLAAKALQKDIETTHWVEAAEGAARASGDHDRHLAEMRAKGLRRVVYLHE